MSVSDWDDLPPKGAPTCDSFQFADPQEFLENEFVFVTHSLGNRIVTDAFQEQAKNVRELADKMAQTPEDRE